MALLWTVILSVTGCDFMRKVAGRPTSEDIAALSLQAAQQQAGTASLPDSAAEEPAAEPASVDLGAPDQLEAKAALDSRGVQCVNSGKLPSLKASELEHRFCIMLGAFSDASNAQNLSSKVNETGLESVVLSYSSSARKAVAAAPCDDYITLLKALDTLRESNLCPQDVWILVNEN